MNDVANTQDISDQHAIPVAGKECIDKVFTFAAPRVKVSNTAHATVIFSLGTQLPVEEQSKWCR